MQVIEVGNLRPFAVHAAFELANRVINLLRTGQALEIVDEDFRGTRLRKHKGAQEMPSTAEFQGTARMHAPVSLGMTSMQLEVGVRYREVCRSGDAFRNALQPRGESKRVQRDTFDPPVHWAA